MARTRWIVSALLLSAVSSAAPASGQVPCAVTKPNQVSAGSEPVHPNSYGNGQLAIGRAGLWPEGTVIFRPDGPGFVDTDGALGMKFLWHKTVRGALTISGRRLDGEAPPIRYEVEKGHEGDDFQPSYVIFPATGCWEVTGRVADARLTFVTRVVKIGAGPPRRRLSAYGDFITTALSQPRSSIR